MRMRKAGQPISRHDPGGLVLRWLRGWGVGIQVLSLCSRRGRGREPNRHLPSFVQGTPEFV